MAEDLTTEQKETTEITVETPDKDVTTRETVIEETEVKHN